MFLSFFLSSICLYPLRSYKKNLESPKERPKKHRKLLSIAKEKDTYAILKHRPKKNG